MTFFLDESSTEIPEAFGWATGGGFAADTEPAASDTGFETMLFDGDPFWAEEIDWKADEDDDDDDDEEEEEEEEEEAEAEDVDEDALEETWADGESGLFLLFLFAGKLLSLIAAEFVLCKSSPAANSGAYTGSRIGSVPK